MQYYDKNGDEIKAGMHITFSDGSVEKIYLTQTPDGEADLGINASNDRYMQAHGIPEEGREFYPLSQFDMKDITIVDTLQQKKESDLMTVLIVEPMKPPKAKEIKHDLETMQSVVGGLIQIVYPFSDNVGVVCNDEGKLLGLPPNRFLRDERTGQPYDILCGTFFIAGLKDDDLCSLTDAQIKKYSGIYDKERLFTVPERKAEKPKER